MVVLFFLKFPFEAEAHFQGSRPKIASLQGTNISHLGKRKIIFKSAFLLGYVSSQEGSSSFGIISGVFFCQTSLPALPGEFSKGISSQAPAPSKRRASRASERPSLEPAAKGAER